MALLDEIIEPRWDYRYYSFCQLKDATWLGSMRNGEGDLWYARFIGNGSAVIRGFDHESSMSPFRRRDNSVWPHLFDGMPQSLVPYRNAVDIEPKEVTFVLWHAKDDRWRTGPVEFPSGDDPDGSEWLLAPLGDDAPSSYVRYAVGYFGLPRLDVEAVRRVFAGQVDAATIATISPSAKADAILKSAHDMGFSMSKTSASKKSDEAAPRKWRRAGEAEFTVSVRDNKVKLIVHGEAVASRDVDGPEFYRDLFADVKKRIEG
jgi:hypothetical protein